MSPWYAFALGGLFALAVALLVCVQTMSRYISRDWASFERFLFNEPKD